MRHLTPLLGVAVGTERTESPIEARMVAALIDHMSQERRTLYIDRRAFVLGETDPLVITTQYEIAGYRLDFLFSTAHSSLAVECDGWEFHEGSGPTKAIADRSRDRKLLARGIPTARFIGREIVRDAASCAREAVELIDALDRHATRQERAA